MGIATVEAQVHLVTEFANSGSLEEYLAYGPPLSETNKVDLIRLIAHALYFLHESGIIHGNLSTRNILLEKTNGGWIPKISDYGLPLIMKEVKERSETEEPSPAGHFNPLQDVSSFISLVFELFGIQDFSNIDAANCKTLLNQEQLEMNLQRIPCSLRSSLFKCLLLLSQPSPDLGAISYLLSQF